ncbi:hypothetical protein GCM10009560_25550 [Nonomuraea longicatena]|uniref:PknH-like extracellular domain-containing protein n=1 Tax=Nonomuraea longicatena TaxID=83682 RepID=A0ABN1P8Y6_9ACTN
MVGLVAAGAFGLVLTPPASAATKLPAKFLTYESKQARKPFGTVEIGWEVSDKPTRLAPLILCRTPAPTGVTTMRTAAASGDAEYRYAEQVALYADANAATEALEAYKTAVQKCAKTGMYRHTVAERRLGDGALQVSRHDIRPDLRYGERVIVVRKGSALIAYAESAGFTRNKPRAADFAKQVRDAKAMAAKVCELPGVCD